jgi:hypothetical protein
VHFLLPQRLRSFLFFGVMAGVFGDEFAPSLPAVVPSHIARLKQEERHNRRLGCYDQGYDNDLYSLFCSDSE